ncbi:vascular endothelial growth factor receptor 1, partial [Copidosoma floridanum]|uniref:vascular endothelial growth factor receptor 1 n=1 Tax=Copidosoma floridanum TaxID=29053 RepID=UPI000C6F9FE2
MAIFVVKTIHKNADLMYISALERDSKVMVYPGQHLNYRILLGTCTKNIAKRELLVIIELCRFGNLQSYLVRHQKNYINQIEPTTGKIDTSMGKNLKRKRHEIYESLFTALSDSSPNDKHTIHYSETAKFSGSIESSDDFMDEDSEPGWRSNYEGDYVEEDLSFLCTEDLLLWAYQVANGMKFLSEKKVLHCDLAARNILLAENNIVKICDFGLAKTLYKDENYKKQCDGKLPIRWMAIESIRDGVFSTMSDVWSFGVVLWELFTLGEIPYAGVGFEVMYQKLVRGYRMTQPAYATDDIYNIMLHCWEEEPTLRPSFTMLVERIGKLLQNDIKTHFLRIYHEYE